MKNKPETKREWYRPGKKILEFHNSKARTRALIGGRGTGKTTAIALETVRHCLKNAGARVYILRKTQGSNEETTQETFEIVFKEMGDAYRDTGVSLFKKIGGGKSYRLPSQMAMDMYNDFLRTNPGATKADKSQWLATYGDRYCGYLLFDGVPENRYQASRFRGFECSMLIFVEADQLARSDLELGAACIRWKGVDPKTCDDNGFILDSGIILDTNPPSPDHWIAQMEAQAKKDQETDIVFWHIPTEENAHNLPPGYVSNLKRMYASNPGMYRRMVLGEYAHAQSGKPVLHAFRQDIHPAASLDFPRGAYLVRGWDFGSTNTIVWSAYWEADGVEYWWDLLEYFARGSDVDTQCRRALEYTEKAFPFWNDRSICSGVRDYCDIAGNQKKDTGSSINVLRTYDIFPGFSRMGLKESLAVYNRLLEKRNPLGEPVYKIDESACPMLFRATLGEYRYPEVGETGYGSNEPMKGEACGDHDHVVDAARYAKMGCLRLIKEEVQKMNAPVGRLAQKFALNPKKRYT